MVGWLSEWGRDKGGQIREEELDCEGFKYFFLKFGEFRFDVLEVLMGFNEGKDKIGCMYQKDYFGIFVMVDEREWKQDKLVRKLV